MIEEFAAKAKPARAVSRPGADAGGRRNKEEKKPSPLAAVLEKFKLKR